MGNMWDTSVKEKLLTPEKEASIMRKILVIGSLGQIGSDLVPYLRDKYGHDNVVASDVKIPQQDLSPYEQLDVLDSDQIYRSLQQYHFDTVYQLASLLSATGEKNPQLAWKINIVGLMNVLEAMVKAGVKNLIWPSSIAAFGPLTPRVKTPNDTILRPMTMYGITKVTGELLLEYYNRRYNLDTRGMRLPGIISSKTLPGGGTTDYAVEIFYELILHQKYTCFLKPDTPLPMMYMPDCIKCMVDLLEAPAERLSRRIYNVTSMTFTPQQLVAEIRKHYPNFPVDYVPDFRQAIADSWPESIDDTLARKDWGWHPDYDLSQMTQDMIQSLKQRLQKS
jgi:threonine 3-dehydrogenase